MSAAAFAVPPASSGAADALLALAEEAERRRDFSAAASCLEASLRPPHAAGLLPLAEARARLRLASLLLAGRAGAGAGAGGAAKAHLERALLLLSPLPSAPPRLKLLAHSHLAGAYAVLGAVPSQKHVLRRGLSLLASAAASGLLPRAPALLWTCNFQAQLASALTVDGDAASALSTLSAGAAAAAELGSPHLELFFASTSLHVHLLCWEDSAAVEAAVARATHLWDGLPGEQKEHSVGLFFYTELLRTFYLLRICDYKAASQYIERLDTAAKSEMHRAKRIKELSNELSAVERTLGQPMLKERERSALAHKQRQLKAQLRTLCGYETLNDVLDYGDKLLLAPPPLHGEWLPRPAVFLLVDLMVVMVGRPKGIFKECGKRINSGLQLIHDELLKLGIVDGVTEANLQHSTIWTAGLYLTLLLQFLENKVAVELTRSEFVEAQEALAQMKNWFTRFPTILQGCESTIEMLRGQYAHSVGCFDEAAFHFLEATKLTESKSMQSMCQVYAAVSYICKGDAESSSQALELVGPAYRTMDSFVGVREKTCIIFVYGLLLMRQHNPQEARNRLASGLRIAHQQLGNIQLVSQYLTIRGTLALQLHDAGQAREILKSSLTLAKKLYDIPTQIWILSVFTELYRELEEKGNEMENFEYERKKEDDLQRRLSEAHSHTFHQELVEKSRIQIQPLHDLSRKQPEMVGATANGDLEIPESVGLSAPEPSSMKRLVEPGSVRRSTRTAFPVDRSRCSSGGWRGWKVAVGGFFRRNERVLSLTPAPIAKRHRARTLETEDGIILCLDDGSLKITRMQEYGYPYEVTKEFMLGFPYWWECCHVRYPRTTGSHAEPQPGSSNTSNTQEDSVRFYLDAFQCGTSYNSAVSSVLTKLINKAKSFSGNHTDAFQNSSHLPNGTPRFEEYTSVDGIATNEKAAVSNDDRGRCSVLCDEVDNMEIDLTAGSNLRERGHDDIVTDVSLAPIVECTNDECNEGADKTLPISTCSQKTPVVLLKTQDCRKRAQHTASIEKPVGPSKEQRSHEKLVAATRSLVIPSSGAYAHQTPVAHGRAMSLSLSTPESLKLRKTRSGRLVVPTLDPGLHRIVYDMDGSISGVKSISGTVGVNSPAPPKASELKTYTRRKRAVSELKTYTRRKRAVNELKIYTGKKRAMNELKTYTRKKRAVSKTYSRKKRAH